MGNFSLSTAEVCKPLRKLASIKTVDMEQYSKMWQIMRMPGTACITKRKSLFCINVISVKMLAQLIAQFPNTTLACTDSA